MRLVVTVISLCNRSVEETRKPVSTKSGSPTSNSTSDASTAGCIWLVINESPTCLLVPIGSVRHRASLTFVKVRSSKGTALRRFYLSSVKGFPSLRE